MSIKEYHMTFGQFRHNVLNLPYAQPCHVDQKNLLNLLMTHSGQPAPYLYGFNYGNEQWYVYDRNDSAEQAKLFCLAEQKNTDAFTQRVWVDFKTGDDVPAWLYGACRNTSRANNTPRIYTKNRSLDELHHMVFVTSGRLYIAKDGKITVITQSPNGVFLTDTLHVLRIKTFYRVTKVFTNGLYISPKNMIGQDVAQFIDYDIDKPLTPQQLRKAIHAMRRSLYDNRYCPSSVNGFSCHYGLFVAQYPYVCTRSPQFDRTLANEVYFNNAGQDINTFDIRTLDMEFHVL